MNSVKGRVSVVSIQWDELLYTTGTMLALACNIHESLSLFYWACTDWLTLYTNEQTFYCLVRCIRPFSILLQYSCLMMMFILCHFIPHSLTLSYLFTRITSCKSQRSVSYEKCILGNECRAIIPQGPWQSQKRDVVLQEEKRGCLQIRGPFVRNFKKWCPSNGVQD